MYPIHINSLEVYHLALKAGGKPLLDWRRFSMDYSIRAHLIHELFGFPLQENDIVRANDRFYHYAWDNTALKVCEECARPLNNFSASFVSHILTKGAHPELAHDPRNFNLLCVKHHNMWEFETDTKRKMKIFRKNQIVIDLMKRDINNR